VNFQWDDDEIRFDLDQHAELDFYSASSLKQQSAGRHVGSDYISYIELSYFMLCTFFVSIVVSLW
jgi:hypothetical protein